MRNSSFNEKLLKHSIKMSSALNGEIDVRSADQFKTADKCMAYIVCVLFVNETAQIGI